MVARLWQARAPKNRDRTPRLLRCEQLESRNLLTALSPVGSPPLVAFSADGDFGWFARALALSARMPSVYGPLPAPTPMGGPTVAKAANVNGNASGYVTGTTASLSVLGSDVRGLSALVYTWTIISTPAGGSAKFSVNGSNAAQNNTVTFSEAGLYGLSVKIVDSAGLSVTSTVAVAVAQTLTSILVTPGTAGIQGGAAQQFHAQGLDQFQRTMVAQPAFTWSASGGTINSTGLFTAPGTAGSYSVAAKSGSIAGGASVSVTVPSPPTNPIPVPGGLQDPILANLVGSLDADGSLNRTDMIEILTSVGTSGTVSATDLSDLKKILANAAALNMPSYVEVLASDVVNGNPANAYYQGAPLGNLAAGSSTAQLEDLIGKWFFGTDLPALTSTSLTYTTASGSLFPSTPSNYNEYQGELGDCYFISALGTIADSNPAAIENMFVNNGDGTYTVRFYTASGTADYVTVNSSLPTYNGMLIYADYGSSVSNTSNSLWIPLAEKAYAQWNATGNEGRDGTNTYNSIQGGWMATVDAQVLGYNATDYGLTGSTEQAMISALAAHDAVTIGTDTSSNSADTLSFGLFGSHAYAVLGYNASTGNFTLYNPWGVDQPGALSWSQLEATCDGFVTAVATGSAPISGANAKAPVAAAASFIPTATTISGVLTSPWYIPNGEPTAAWTTLPAGETTPATSAATTDDTYDGRPVTIFFDGSMPHDSTAETSDSPAAAGVDAVLAFQYVRLSGLI